MIFFMKTDFIFPTVQQFYILLIYNILKVKKVLEPVGTCWNVLDAVGLLDCWNGILSLAKAKVFFFLKIQPNLTRNESATL